MDPTAAITKAMKRVVRAHRMAHIAADVPNSIPSCGDIGPGRYESVHIIVDFANVVAHMATGKLSSIKEAPEW